MPDVTDGDLVIAVIQTRVRTGGCSQQDLADTVGMSKAGVRYRVHQLAASGILDTTKAGDIRPCDADPTPVRFGLEMDFAVLDGKVEHAMRIIPY